MKTYEPTSEVEEVIAYLADGGLGEVFTAIDMSKTMEAPQVAMDTNMAFALLTLASEALNARRDKQVQ